MTFSSSLKDPVDVEGTPYSAVASGGRTVSAEYQHILPETQGIFWNDDFFDDDDVIAVFDFDYDKMITFQTPLAAVGQFFFWGPLCLYFGLILGLLGLIIVAGLYVFSLAACFLKSQVRWRAEANHVAITRDGIRFVQDRQKTCWGLPMCDKGKHSKTVPFDKITDCDINEPAGNAFLIFPRILYTVNVDTASSGSESNLHELVITGLKDPNRFKALVWAMKRNLHQLPTQVYQPPKQKSSQLELSDLAQLKKSASSSSQSSGGVRGILRDIRDELRQNNQLLRTLHEGEGVKDCASQGKPTDATLV
ncbi:MAG: hypothetical protein SGBAC_000836 [Bacillariaceae sp.]